MDILTVRSVYKQGTGEGLLGPSWFQETDLGQEMDGFGFEQFGAVAARESQEVDYRRIVGETQPPRATAGSEKGEQYVRQTSHGHGHETAAQRYSATRILAGLGPER